MKFFIVDTLQRVVRSAHDQKRKAFYQMEVYGRRSIKRSGIYTPMQVMSGPDTLESFSRYCDLPEELGLSGIEED